MVSLKGKAMGSDLTRDKICQYVWARYIDNASPEVEVDEQEAVHFFEKYYSKHPLNEDSECFFYAILLYELAFIDETNRARYLVKAKEVFEVYRNISGDTEWDATEDRYIDTCDMIERDGLVEVAAAAVEKAPEIPGMVLVPAGSFYYGEDNKQSVLEPFYIDVFPVTNADYRAFVEDTQYRRPVLWDRRGDLVADDMPVTGVSWMDALQYCKWAKKSLPTAEQWEKAARGPNGLSYPWGNEPPTPDKANYYASGPQLRPIGDFAAQRSPYGVAIMAGGVWEWTNTPYTAEDGCQLIKGGSFVDPGEYLASAKALWANKKEKSDIIGFRCVKAFETL